MSTLTSEDRERLLAWLFFKEAQSAIEAALARAREVVGELREARRFPPELLNEPVTI